MSFLPADYEVPKSGGDYMKLKTGDNKFRIIGPAITGWSGWDKSGEKMKPHRARKSDDPKLAGLSDLKPFMAFPVWNYDESAVQILELTQSTVMTPIANFSRDPEWGDPSDVDKGYGFVVSKSGSGKDGTKYEVRPAPSRPLPDAIKAAAVDKPWNLDLLFDGGDPFETSGTDDGWEEV